MKRIMPFLTVLVCFIFAMSFVIPAAAAGDRCDSCGMKLSEHVNTEYVITFKDGKTKHYCCPHCGLYVHAEEKANVKSAKARDFISSKWMDPAKMYFLSGSSAVPACSPSWIAFGSKSEAEKFQKGFGGEIYGFEDALKERMKQPKMMEKMPK
ncbi:MAG TPA: nitrous oxide reductase accessory protein NosL [Thermodesulfovibrionales bacterium]|nr:nitrous oxide reductase accessory protein NosL [Thermodesulfovibrionales bacterium]